MDINSSKNNNLCSAKITRSACAVINQEADALKVMSQSLDDSFTHAVKMVLDCKGSVVLTGIGKAGIIGQKISATLASTGTPSHFIHAAEAIHGDLGRLRADDIVIALSYSGKSSEIVELIDHLKQQDVPMIGMTGNKNSPLAIHSNVTLWLGDLSEACPIGLAPSTSTTCMLAMGDALALTVMQLKDFQAQDFAKFHPGGSLGRQLVTVEQAALFSRGMKLPLAPLDCTLQQAIELAEADTELRHGCILLINDNGTLAGLITDGDLRRGIMQQKNKIHEIPATKLMTANPKVVRPDTLASEALSILHKYRIDELPVVDNDGKPVGLIDVQDVMALKII
ncbi:MAG: KpsF/GutQ family sugar-phosphate isomerase [Phycisphaerae bacterium]|nr:KpsF/GutQ family sugar-phosphate isomerase [Phycisphaerae bacterium]